jgi:hypothetical protein
MRLELPGFDFKQKRSGAGEMFFEAVGGKPAAENLPADSRVARVIKVIRDINSVVGIRQRVNGGVSCYNYNGFLDCEFVPGGLLFDKARRDKRLEVFAAAAVGRGQLGSIDFDNEIVYFEGAYRRQTMLNGFDADGAFSQSGSTRPVGDI